jgi:cellulose synthase/poly-beta-1,6-N-acetylglucosamine synthase-like glycosyltransferase
VAHFGYLLVEATQDTRDWQRPGVGSIVGRGTPPPGQGGIILLHDGGGDRRQTLAGTAQLIARLRASGYRFRTVSQLVGIRSPAGRQRAPLVARLQGLGLLWALRLAFALTGLVGVLLIPIGVLAVARAVVIFVLARRHARTARTQPDRAVTLLGPLSVTAIVPAYNEEVGIERTVRSLLASTEVDIEVVVVDDGSTDRTSEIVGMITDPRLVLVRQANAGKAAALNRGIGRAQHDLIVMMDGDTVFEPGTVAALAGAFADPTVGAVSGNTKVGNRSGLLGRWQHIEYVIGFNLDRRMYDHLRCMPTVPGAVGAFRRSALEAVGGLSLDTLAEDTDVTMAIQRAGWRVVYRQDAVAWTEAPATIDALWRQRYRWSYGTMQAMWKHRGAIRERSRLGRVGLPYLFFFQVLLPLIAPAIDLFALYGVVFLNPVPVAEYWLGFNLISLALAIYAFRLDGERLRPLWALPLQQIVYRQLMYAVVIQSVVSALVGARLHWHTSQRLGVDTRA